MHVTCSCECVRLRVRARILWQRGRCRAGYSNTGGPPLPRKRAPFPKKTCIPMHFGTGWTQNILDYVRVANPTQPLIYYIFHALFQPRPEYAFLSLSKLCAYRLWKQTSFTMVGWLEFQCDKLIGAVAMNGWKMSSWHLAKPSFLPVCLAYY